MAASWALYQVLVPRLARKGLTRSHQDNEDNQDNQDNRIVIPNSPSPVRQQKVSSTHHGDDGVIEEFSITGLRSILALSTIVAHSAAVTMLQTVQGHFTPACVELRFCWPVEWDEVFGTADLRAGRC
jgi:hypothetical protein